VRDVAVGASPGSCRSVGARCCPPPLTTGRCVWCLFFGPSLWCSVRARRPMRVPSVAAWLLCRAVVRAFCECQCGRGHSASPSASSPRADRSCAPHTNILLCCRQCDFVRSSGFPRSVEQRGALPADEQ
jgi:hypothetical protein